MKYLPHLIAAGAALVIVGGKKLVPMAGEAVVSKISDAIANAEGFFVKGSKPARNNNPGNLTSNIGGAPAAVGKDGMFNVYLTPADGWSALNAQVRLMLNGKSKIYNPEMTIHQVAQKYTTTEQSIWASNVARHMGIPTTTRLSEIA